MGGTPRRSRLSLKSRIFRYGTDNYDRHRSNGGFHEVIGRAEEIARAMGSLVAGPEHFLLGMLHANSWPIHILAERGILDPGEAEAAVMSIISAPGYSPPAASRPRSCASPAQG